jgi:hypothetical protein
MRKILMGREALAGREVYYPTEDDAIMVMDLSRGILGRERSITTGGAEGRET